MVKNQFDTLQPGYDCPDMETLCLNADGIICTSGQGGAGDLDEVEAFELY